MAKKPSLPIAKTKAAKPIPVKIVSEPSSIATDDGYKERERKYRAQDALRTIQEAEKFKTDKGLMKDVKKLATEQVNSLKKFC